MNKKQLERIELVVSVLEEQKYILESIGDEEQEKYDNSPENLQDSERVQRYLDVADTLEDMCRDLDSTIETLRSEIIDW